jgi:hypothetical protein
MLAMYPQRYAEGGAVQDPSLPVQAPMPTAQAPLPASQSFQAPSVAARQTQLTPIFAPGQVPADYQGKFIDPTVLSSSQQYARDREAQDLALAQAFAAAGAQSPVGRDYRQTQQAMRRGEVSIDDLKTKITDPIFESRVRNAYAAIGRTGGVTTEPLVQTAEGLKKVQQSEMDYWINQYKEGKLDPQQFEKIFLTQESNKPQLMVTKAPPKATGTGMGNVGTGIGIGGKPQLVAVDNPYAATAATMLGKLGTPEVPTVKKGFTTAQYLTPGTPLRFFEEGGDVKK